MLEIIDTARQKTIRDQWIRESEGFLLVYSITCRSSFKSITKFYDHIIRVKESSRPLEPRICASPYPSHRAIMLVGTHSERGTQRVVSAHEGRALARELGCSFVEASTKNCVNVGRAFYDLVRQIRSVRVSDMPEKSWLDPCQLSKVSRYFNTAPARSSLGIYDLWDRIRIKKN
jgi:GTPase KRas